MIAPAEFLDRAIDPALKWLGHMMGRYMGPPEAQVPLLAIALQESKLSYRAQIIEPYGCPIDCRPAHGFYQFEGNQNQALELTMHNPKTEPIAMAACAAQGVEWALDHVWWTVLGNDWLATVMARLLIYLDPYPLPTIGDETGTWALYIRCWNPGQPHPEQWSANYQLALETVLGSIAV